MLKGKQLYAYVAGIIDGEGSIDLYKTSAAKEKPRYALRVAVGITNEWMPQFLKFNFGGSIHCIVHSTPKHKNCWLWVIQARQAGKFLSLIIPYLQLKRPHAELAISYQSRKHRCNYLSNEERVLDQADRILMKSYNKRGKKEVSQNG